MGWRAPEVRAGNAALPSGRSPTPLWHREYWDRFIRNDRHFQQMVEYIHRNPVKAGLVERPEDRHWSSAFVDGGKAAGTAALPSGSF